MAITNRQGWGFRPYKTRDGSAMPKPIRGFIASTYQSNQASTNIDVYIGDPVRRLSTGYFVHAAATEDIFGIVVNVVKYYDGAKVIPGSKRVPGGTTYTNFDTQSSEIMVLPAAGIEWEVDVNDNTTCTTFAQYLALLGENADHIYVPSGTIGYPQLNISSHNTTSKQWRIVDVSQTVDNQDYSGANVKLIVHVNQTQLAPFVTSGI